MKPQTKAKFITTTFAYLLLIAPSQAALIDLTGMTRDTNSGLDWLDTTATSGMSYNEVTLQLGAGGAFEGYRYATLPELEGFLTAAGGTGPFLGSNHLPLDGWVTTLLNLWGVTANQPGFNVYTSVLWGDSSISTWTDYVYDPFIGDFGELVEVEITGARVETGILQNFYGGGFATARFGVGQYDLRTVDYSSSALGSALVKSAPVPDSGSTFALASLSCLSLAGMNRFQRRRLASV